MFDPNAAATTFLTEADELLARVEEVVLDLHPGEDCTEGINQLFRAFHTIKGSGAMFGFDAVASFTHHVESVLDQVRAGALPLSSELLEVVLQAKDTIKSLLEASQGREIPDEAMGARVIAALNRLAIPPTAGVAAVSLSTDNPTANHGWKIRFRPHPELLAHGGNPAMLLYELREVGDCTVTAHTEDLPLLDQLEPERCYFWWEIELHTDCSINVVRDVFLFVEGSSEVVIEPLEGKQPAIADASISSAPVGPEPQAQPTAQRKAAATQSTVRVASEKLDALVNLVGELVMNQSRLTQAASRFDSADLAAPVEEIERLVAELRDNVLGIRMMPIGTTFTRFRRLVHDLSTELGKEIDLVTEGAETELDKTVLDQLGDPLVHLIRNSIDHGLETPEQRRAAGKPETGTIRLAAVHTGSNVVISIHDDGKGLDLDRIRARAVERQLIPRDTNLPDSEIYNLIFLPGFSTAERVSGVSGRGVGMDVVKRQIESLRGSVSIVSERGRGTTISLTLPLTLAIIDGLLVETAGQQYIVPMSLVAENVELRREDRLRNNARNTVAVRGALVPYIDMRRLFTLDYDEPEIEKVVIVRHEGQRVGLVVDRVIGSHQTVIQSLGKFFAGVEAFSGATIMGDGRVTLILDIAAVVRLANSPSTVGRAA